MARRLTASLVNTLLKARSWWVRMDHHGSSWFVEVLLPRDVSTNVLRSSSARLEISSLGSRMLTKEWKQSRLRLGIAEHIWT